MVQKFNPDVVLAELPLDYMMTALRNQGWCVLDDFFPEALVNALVAEATALQDAVMQQAGIGRSRQHQVRLDQRKDCIYWLDSETLIQQQFLDIMEALKIQINRQLLLGLFDYEAHFARYYNNGFYVKHLDAFKGRSNRVLSTVLYLNEQWQAEDGGELVLFDEIDNTLELGRFSPIKGRFAIFLSEDFYHQVNVAKATRHSIAGWFRVNATDHRYIDPPQ